ncbi:TRAP-type C4-dicarboxylate transport system, small permease component [Rhodovulum sp. ES.010]|uniref:TRAP transporter small permease n=1 Tax=Rhodovulum sp. ES.010 TaxID=1882821 RepID=UPI000926AF49|nr:TRAP transporter small permease [Rhodovulum sp. ES.010]SIO10366.1 TRAP-type C4-dicarboxylate transport system, small permease component [Rhodovulum sp. ES.010]
MRLLDAVELLTARFAALLLVATGAMLTYEVVARYFFTAPTIWAAELSQLCLIWACPLAAPWVLSARRHIRVTAVTQCLPRTLRRWLEVLAMLVVAGFSVVVLWFGYEIFIDSLVRGRTTGTMLDLPAWLREAAIPVGFALLTLSALGNAWRAATGPLPKNAEMAE